MQITRKRPPASLRKLRLAVFLGCASLLPSPSSADTLEEGFRLPPPEAKPRVWWHWMDGNVSLPGIDRDLSWMEGAGIGGVQNFDGAIQTPQIVDHKLIFGTPEWKQAIRHAVEDANAKGLEFTIASAPGWSETGGPWVRPEQAMKKLVWSEIDVSGGKPLALNLPKPPNTSGPFQNIEGGGAEPSEPSPPQDTLPQLYRDAVVIAYRVPEAEKPLVPRITASAPVDIARLTDGDLMAPVSLPVGKGQDAWVQFDYGHPETIRAATLVVGRGQKVGPILQSLPLGSVQASDDGTSFRTIATLPLRSALEQTVAFPATTARSFRLVLEGKWAPGPLPAFDFPQAPPHEMQIMELQFTNGARVQQFEDKAGWSSIAGVQDMVTPAVDPSSVIGKGNVLNITSKLDAAGKLTWTPPPGRWRIVRLGWSLTGKLNNPASKAGTGLEVDKLNAADVTSHLDTYLGLYESAVGKDLMGARGIRAMLNDSYEALSANWTDDILVEFTKRRGYDPMPWLPVLIGRVVESSSASDRFLWDFRRTLGDLIAQNHYNLISAYLRQRGLGHYAESHEGLRAFVGNGMEVKKGATVPMGATWVGTGSTDRFLPDIRESASVAHTYGQNLVAAESFTTMSDHYAWPPERLKATADLMMANGLNRFVIHTSVHQPTETPGPGPGLGLGPFGQWFTRKETWADMAQGWTAYLGRSSHLLQQGRNVADIAWFYGEDDNITEVYQHRFPEVPSGLAMDFVNADALQHELTVSAGKLTSRSGAGYRLLVLDPVSHRMTLATLRRLAQFVDAGLTVVGSMPDASPSLADNQEDYRKMAGSLWSRWHDKRIFSSIASAMQAKAFRTDIDFAGSNELGFVHRSTQDGEVYFIANLGDTAKALNPSFRVKGLAPEIWNAETATISQASYQQKEGRTLVPLALAPREAIFVVFRHPTDQATFQAPAPVDRFVGQVTRSWQVRFDGACAATTLTMPKLTSWTEAADPSIRYFSGTAVYSSEFTLKEGRRPAGSRLLLDLGAVKNLASVSLNGKPVGTAWKSPFQLDVTAFAKQGRNTLDIRVANLWPNRLIGDKVEKRENACAFAAFNPFTASSPPAPSGLLGPVMLIERDLREPDAKPTDQ